MNEKIVYERKKYNITFQVVSKKGGRHYSFDTKGKDRLFFIRLIEGKKIIDFPYSHDNQIGILKLVLDNVILSNVFRRDISKFRDALTEIERKRNENKN